MDEAATTRIPGEDPDELISRGRYRKLLLKVVLSVSAVAVLPLLTMSTIAWHQFHQAFRSESTRPMERFVDAGKQSLESFLSERLTALARVTQETPFEELRDSRRLDSLLAGMKLEFGGFVDLGLIDEDGVQVAYAGEYGLAGRSYRDQPWYREVTARGSTVSDVFLGYRNLPHIVLAIQQEYPNGHSAVLRTTIDTDVFHFLVRERAGRRPGQESVCLRCHSLAVQPFGDAFIVNDTGLLQTPSRLYGEALERAPLPSLPADNDPTGLFDATDERGVSVVVAYARIARSPFTLVLVNPRETMQAAWQPLGRELVVFPAISALLILAVIIVGGVYVVRQARETDRRRAALYHKMEYTNKLAAIGRLGAGVAHEINNPLSIITQKAGLLNDLLTMSDELPPREKMLELIDSVLRSAERCGGITHRLLGFAKHMDVQREKINLDVLLREVLGFLEKEASYRSIRIDFAHADDPPPIVSDRGQLQQVFLNIINNAFAAVEDGGRIEIGIARAGADAVAVSIADNGIGIPESQLEQIFDPFFTTKKGAGTGLGLSITWGIVQKLGGQIGVRSTVGEGTCFTVTLPLGEPGQVL